MRHRPFLLALGLLALLGFQAVHRHTGHESGFYKPHVDCSLCAWTGGAGARTGARGDSAIHVSWIAWPAVPARTASDFFLPYTLPFGRGPPAIPSI
ncbi:MAG: hypothetical protein IPP68_05200 [Elusimicrobia bacterium]|nr:hypothetical protein [Elusimicrobiota bacterium]